MGEPTVRVQQLAATLRQPVPEVISRLKDAGIVVRGGAGRLSHDQVAAALEGFAVALEPSHAQPMLIEAFAAARDSGREDWREMTHAVLKNRLLDATNRGFNELDYGAPTFAYFVSLFPNLLTTRVDENGTVRVEVDGEAVDSHGLPELVSVPPKRERIRNDLWEAFADFGSGEVYVWDISESIATVGEQSDGHIKIPTLTPAEEASWRSEFVGALSNDLSDSEKAVLADWQTRRLPSVSLPPRLRGVWNGRLRANMLAKISTFFAEHDLTAPDSLLVSSDHASRREPNALASSDADLRNFVHRCVAVMTERELQSLALPVHIVMRASGKR